MFLLVCASREHIGCERLGKKNMGAKFDDRLELRSEMGAQAGISFRYAGFSPRCRLSLVPTRSPGSVRDHAHRFLAPRQCTRSWSARPGPAQVHSYASADVTAPMSPSGGRTGAVPRQPQQRRRRRRGRTAGVGARGRATSSLDSAARLPLIVVPREAARAHVRACGIRMVVLRIESKMSAGRLALSEHVRRGTDP